MATDQFSCLYVSGASVYIRIWNEEGQVFDTADHAFKALADAATPYIVCTEQPEVDGAGRSGYVATLDYGLISTGTDRKNFRIHAYTNATPAADDLAFSTAVVTLPEVDNATYDIRYQGSLTSTAGVAVRMVAQLRKNGLTVPLTAGTCTVNIREHGSGANLFTVTASAPNAWGVFELSQDLPAFTADRLYMSQVIINDGTTGRTSIDTFQTVN